MNIAMICCTPYHILNAINMRLQLFQNQSMDLFICDHFNSSSLIYMRVKQANIFSDVMYIEEKKWIRTQVVQFKVRESVENIAQKKTVYDKIFICTAAGSWGYHLCDVMRNENPNIEICYVEDGMGSYIRELPIRYGIKEMYFYEPKLVSYETGIKIKQLPKISNDILKEGTFLKLIASIFGDLVGKINKQIIYFDQPFLEGNICIGNVEILNDVLQVLDRNSLYVKLHPRSNIQKYKDIDIQISERSALFPFEIIVPRKNMHDKCLVTISSTVVLTPKTMFNRDYNTILLYKLISNYEQESAELDLLMNNFVNLYGDRYVFIPESIDELKDIADRLHLSR